MPKDAEYLSGLLKRDAAINPCHPKVLANGLWGGVGEGVLELDAAGGNVSGGLP